jgi:hypothetical protein
MNADPSTSKNKHGFDALIYQEQISSYSFSIFAFVIPRDNVKVG